MQPLCLYAPINTLQGRCGRLQAFNWNEMLSIFKTNGSVLSQIHIKWCHFLKNNEQCCLHLFPSCQFQKISHVNTWTAFIVSAADLLIAFNAWFAFLRAGRDDGWRCRIHRDGRRVKSRTRSLKGFSAFVLSASQWLSALIICDKGPSES